MSKESVRQEMRSSFSSLINHLLRKLRKTNAMWITIAVAILLCGMTSSVEGQVGVLGHADNIYVYPRFNKTFTEANTFCNGLEADLALLDDETVRNMSIAKRSLQGNEFWVKDNSTSPPSDCKFVDIRNGAIGRKNCSMELPYICKGQAWRNITDWSGGLLGFSATKLRRSDGSTICKSGREGLMGQLVTITSADLQTVLSNHKQAVEYYISRNNGNSLLTKNYTNWVSERSPTQGNNSCIQMKSDGKWDNVGCLQYKYFICQWMKEPSTTTVQVEPKEETTRMPSGAVTTETTKNMRQETTQKAGAKTEAIGMTTVKMTSTSGSAIVSVSKFTSVILLATALKHVLW